jgi:signal transduction histidine kinase
MLHEFIATYRDAIIRRSREKLTARPWPAATTIEIDHGVPLFLTQLSETLRHEERGMPYSPAAISATATVHGRELLAQGFTVSQVVHDYGDICQAVTELAIEQNAPITTTEFHTLNRCLDTATADAVTEHARITAESRSAEEVERSGRVAHETRDLLNTALLAFEALKRGTVAINGSTGAVLGRSLTSLRDVVDSTLAEVRLASQYQRRERVSVASFVESLAAASRLHAEYRGLQFVVEPIDADLAVKADPQILGSAVTNLVNNAFKFTRPGGRVVLKACRKDALIMIDVEDECGGLPEGKGDPFQSFGERRGTDRTGLGLGLSIARKAVLAHGGDISIRNIPGHGCIFSIAVPMAPGDAPGSPAVES